jgi:hypothetical protein
MDKDKPVSLEEYQGVGEEWFPKYQYVSNKLGYGAKAEDILKVMESLAAQAMKKRNEDKPTIGFSKNDDQT